MGTDEERIRREIVGVVVRPTPTAPVEPTSSIGSPPRSRERLVFLGAIAATAVVTLVLVYVVGKLIGGTPTGRVEEGSGRSQALRMAEPQAPLKGGTGDVTGDVFVTMKSGDVKRGADVEVALIPAIEQFESEWRRTAEEARREYANAGLAHEQARQEYDQATKRELDSIGAGRTRVSSQDEADRYLAAAKRIDEVRTQYRSAALRVIAAAQPKTARTDVNGHYDLRGLPLGQYYIFAQHKVFDNNLHWIVPLEVKSGANRIDLSNSNAGWPFQ